VIARIWIALVVLLLAAAHASAMPIDMPGDPEMADVVYHDDVPLLAPEGEPVADTRGISRITYVVEKMPASASGENLFRPPRPSIV
jgi:hypothetical protein